MFSEKKAEAPAPMRTAQRKVRCINKNGKGQEDVLLKKYNLRHTKSSGLYKRRPPTKEVCHGGLAQLARAPALQAGGQRFESVILHLVREK